MRKGLSLLEILLALSLLGGILLLANQLMFQNQTIASRQLLQRQASEDARLTMLRLSEIVSQASYIYPLKEEIDLPGGIKQKTGKSALAVLVSWGSPYCPSEVAGKDKYCAFLYRLEPRSSYLSDLGQQPLAGSNVLIEYRLHWLDWPRDTPPSRNWTALTGIRRGIVMDSVDAAQTDFSNLRVGGRQVVDKYLKNDVDPDDPNALIISAQPRVRVAFSNGFGATREEDIAARAAPRGIAP
jgi:prepilin-type N-terminal cleavage/methylation domain-containing protein